MIELPWWCEIDVRIVHPELNPVALTQVLRITPSISQLPGESKVPYGECHSAGYWCVSHRVSFPDRPDIAITWAEQFLHRNEIQMQKLVNQKADINIYLGIHANVMAVGFVFPATPTISKLALKLGIEFYSK